MPETRLRAARWAMIVGLAALTLGVGLGRAGRLTYHEAFVAQAAREMVAHGDVLVPTIGNRPWLEKPPLAVWLVALTARLAGGMSEWVARIPSAIASAMLAVGLAAWAARRFGASVGLLTGLIQVTSVWLMIRGRLAEADMLLACLLTWTILAFDRMQDDDPQHVWRWIFFAGLGSSSLVKGIGFGAALVAAVIVLTLALNRDREGIRRLLWPQGWLLTVTLALTWPALVALRHPEAMKLWTLHVTDRLAVHPEHFTGGSWWQYGPGLLWQVLPWTPLALVGACRSFARAFQERQGPDRFLWAWAVGPIALLSLATVKNAHYVIYALPPWSVWAALSLQRVGVRLQNRGWAAVRLRQTALVGFGGLGIVCGLGFGVLGPRFDHRGVEWAFYESAGHSLRAREPLALLYDDWDRDPYYTPFGPVPHDLAVRLYYLDRPACWRMGTEALLKEPPAQGLEPFAVIGRDRDLSALRRLGRVETVLCGPKLRARASRVDDRTFVLYRITPEVVAVAGK